MHPHSRAQHPYTGVLQWCSARADISAVSIKQRLNIKTAPAVLMTVSMSPVQIKRCFWFWPEVLPLNSSLQTYIYCLLLSTQPPINAVKKC